MSIPSLRLHAVLTVSLALAGCASSSSSLRTAEQARPIKVQVLAFNDFHGQLEPPTGGGALVTVGFKEDGTRLNEVGGGATYFAHHVAALRAQNPHTVVVSAGDLLGGTPLLSALFHDEPTIEAMNLIGLDIHGVGNHEFDEGSTELLRMQAGGCHPVDGCQDGTPFAGASFQFLAANVLVDPTTGRTLFPRYTLREFEGVRVAFIGMTLEGTPQLVTPQAIAGITFKSEVETVNALIPELRAQGVEAVVVIVHEGGTQKGHFNECKEASGAIVELAQEIDDEVDVLVTGHTHQAYNCVIDGKRVTSAASAGRVLTRIEMTLDPATRDVVQVQAENGVVTRTAGEVAAVSELIKAYATKADPLRNRVVGRMAQKVGGSRSSSPSGETAMGNLIADAQFAATQPAHLGGAQLAFMNPGGIRGSGELPEGEITFGQLFTIQPFGNTLVTLTLTGEQLDTLLEQQAYELQSDNTPRRVLQVSNGFSYTWKASAPEGQRVDIASIKLNGKPLEPQGRYRVTVNSFLASGSDGFAVLKEGTDRLGGVVDVEALEQYLKKNSPVQPPALGRIQRVE
jgi:5'-nucleotidase